MKIKVINKNAFCVLLLFLGLTNIYGQRQQDIKISGSDNIANVVKSSLNTIPNLRIGNITDNFSYKARLIRHQLIPEQFYYSVLLDGKLLIDYADITMSDGVVIRFESSGHNLKNNSFFASSGGQELSASIAIDVSSASNQNRSSYNSVQIDWGELTSGATPIIRDLTLNKKIESSEYIDINCSGMVSRFIHGWSTEVERIRKKYDAIKLQQSQNNSLNVSNSTENNNSNRSRSTNNSSVNNSSNTSNHQRSGNNSQSQPVWDAYQQTKSNTQKTLDEWQKAREASEEDDDNGEREESTAERKQREYEEEKDRLVKEREARDVEERRIQSVYENREAIFRKLKSEGLPTTALNVNTNKLYYFLYTKPSLSEVKENFSNVFISNIFAIGQYPDGTWPMKTTIEAEIGKLVTERTKYLSGYYTSDVDAQNAWDNFRNEITSTGATIMETNYAGKNANVNANSKLSDSQQTLDYWGNPIKKSNTTQQKKTTTQPKEPEKKKQKLDYWGNPIK